MLPSGAMDISNSKSKIEEWSEHVTVGGRTFWYNATTKSSTYNKPRVLMTEVELSIPPCKWTEYMNEKGQNYYSDGVTSSWCMPEEFRVWKSTTDDVTKRQNIEPVSELSIKFQDKFSQRTTERLQRINIYEEKESQRKQETKDLQVSMKRVLNQLKLKAKEERDAIMKKEQTEAKAKEKKAKEEERDAKATAKQAKEFNVARMKEEQREAKARAKIAKAEREAKAKEERDSKAKERADKNVEVRKEKAESNAARLEKSLKRAAIAAEHKQKERLHKTEKQREEDRAKDAVAKRHRRKEMTEENKKEEHIKSVVRTEKSRQTTAANAAEAAQSREAEQRRHEQARQGLDTGERKEHRADDLSARLRAIHSLSPNTRERQRIAAHDRAAEHTDVHIQAIKTEESKVTLNMVDCPKTEALLRFDHCDTPGKEASIPLLAFWEMSGLESIPYVNDINRIVHEMNTADDPEVKQVAERQYNELKESIANLTLRREDIVRIVHGFREDMKMTQELLACGACGVRQYTKPYKHIRRTVGPHDLCDTFNPKPKAIGKRAQQQAPTTDVDSDIEDFPKLVDDDTSSDESEDDESNPDRRRITSKRSSTRTIDADMDIDEIPPLFDDSSSDESEDDEPHPKRKHVTSKRSAKTVATPGITAAQASLPATAKVPEEETQYDIMQTYFRMLKVNERHARQQASYNIAPLSKLTRLVLNDEQVAKYEARGEYKALASVYKSPVDEKLYYLHPETVQRNPDTDDEEVFLCHHCYRTCLDTKDLHKLPDFSIANGFDYGDFTRIPGKFNELNQIEKAACAYVRLYGSIVKLKPKMGRHRTIEGHIITFFQDAPESAATALNKALPDMNALQQTRVMFFGTKDQFERSRQDGVIALVPLTVRADGIMNFLKCLQVVNPRYANCHIQDTPELRAQIDATREELFKNVIIADNEDLIKQDNVATSDIANGRIRHSQGETEIRDEEIALATELDGAVVEDEAHKAANEPAYEGGSSVFLVNQSKDLLPCDKPNSDIIPENMLKFIQAEICQHIAVAPLPPPAGNIDDGFRRSLEDDMAECDEEEIHVGNQPDDGGTNPPLPPPIDIIAHRTTDTPVNEFKQNDILYYDAFPTLFPFHEGMPFAGSIPKRYIRHLLMQRTGAFAADASFVFTAVNQMMRHAAIHAVSAKVKSSPAAMEEFGNLVKSNEFKAEVEKAIERGPRSKEAKKIVKKVDSLIRTTGKIVPFSPMARADATTSLYAMTQFYGPPSVFMTFSMDDAHTCLTLRLSYPSMQRENAPANTTFPATDSGFIDALKNNEPTFMENIPITDSKLIELMNNNPVAAAEYFRMVMDAIYEHLLGIRQDRHVKRTVPLGARLAGIFGIMRAVYHALEVQGRIALHAHAALWPLFSVPLLQEAAAFEELVKLIREVMDSMFQAHLPIDVHLRDTIRMMTPFAERTPLVPKRMTYDMPVAPMFDDKFGTRNPSEKDLKDLLREIHEKRPDNYPKEAFFTSDTKSNFEHRVSQVMGRNGMHAHCATCHKGVRAACRLGMKAPNYSQTAVGNIQFEVSPADMHKSALVEDEYVVDDVTEDAIPAFKTGPDYIQPLQYEPVTDRDYCRCPFAKPDHRLFAWEIFRPRLPQLDELSDKSLYYKQRLLDELKGVTPAADQYIPVSDSAATVVEDKALQQLVDSMLDGFSPEDKEKIAQLNEVEWQGFWDDLQKQETNFSEKDRQIVRELFAYRNSAVVITSPTLANCLGTNTNAQLLGSLVQAKAILFYLIKYITKDATALASTFAVIKYAQDKQKEYPSIAEDAGTDKRDGAQFLQIILNKLNGISELGDTQAAAALLGMPAQESTCRRTYVFIAAALASVKQHHLQDQNSADNGAAAWVHDVNVDVMDRNEQAGDDCDNLDIFDDRQMGILQEDTNLHAQVDEDFIPGQSRRQAPSLGGAPIYKLIQADGSVKLVPVAQHTNYMFRGKLLEAYNLLEYVCIVDIVPIDHKRDKVVGDNDADDDRDDHNPNNSDDENVSDDEGQQDRRRQLSDSRKKSTLFRFDAGHPLYDTHQQKIRSKLFIPVLSGGRPPDFRDLVDEKRFEVKDYTELGERARKSIQRAVQYFMVLLVPWRLQDDPSRRAVGELQPDIALVTAELFEADEDGGLVDTTDLSWDNFVRWIQCLDGKTWDPDSDTFVLQRPSFRNRCIRQYLENVTRNLRTTTDAKRRVMEHRHKCATKFELDGKPTSKIGICDLVGYINKKHGRRRQKGLCGDEVDVMELDEDDEYGPEQFLQGQDIYPTAEMKAIERVRDDANLSDKAAAALAKLMRELEYIEDSRKNLEKILEAVPLPADGRFPKGSGQDSCVYHQSGSAGSVVVQVDEVWEKIKEKQFNYDDEDAKVARFDPDMFLVKKPGDDDSKSPVESAMESFPSLDSFFSPESIPSDDQRSLLLETYEHCKLRALHKIFPGQCPQPEQLARLILGGPGVGKTWTMNKAQDIRNAFGYKCVSTAFTGSACCLIPGAQTMNSLFKIKPQSKGPKNMPIRRDDSISNAAELSKYGTFWKSLDGVNIDEISMIDAILLGKASQQAQTFRDNYDLPFGGLDYDISGDFFQLPPVGGTSLTVDVLKDAVVIPTDAASRNDKSYTSAVYPRQVGINAFRRCKLRELTQQKRAEKDPEHTAFIQNMRNFNIPYPISDDLLKSLERRVLTSKDMNDPEWESAPPICVTSNAERFSLMKAMAKKYATRHGVPVVVWEYSTKAKTPLKNDANSKDYSELFDQVIKHPALRSQLFQTSAGTMGMFVKGAPAFILENCNTDKRLSNGSFVRMHSLTFDDKKSGSSENIRQVAIQIAAALPGEEVTIDLVPKYINVTFEPDKEEGKSWPDNENLGAGPEEIVVPMPELSKRRLLDVIIDFNPAGFDVKRQLGVECKVHRVCLGFTLTCHKLQGATVNKLILELNQRPFKPPLTYYMLLVALSRVSSGADMRIMPLFRKEGQKVHPLAYLKKLRPDDNLRIWFAGFHRKSDGGDGSWDPVLALAEKQRLDVLKSASKTSASKTTEKRTISSSKSKTAKTSATITSRSDTDKPKGKSRKLKTGDSARHDSANKDLQRDLTSPASAAAPSFQPPTSRRLPQFWELSQEQSNETTVFLQSCISHIREQSILTVNGQDLCPWDVASLRDKQWLSSCCVDTFLTLKYHEFQRSTPLEDYRPCTLLSAQFGTLLLKYNQPWQQLTAFTANIAAEYLDGDIIFPYCTGSHFMSCIISKTELRIYVVDGYDWANHDDFQRQIKEWYTLEHISKRQPPPDFERDGWEFLTSSLTLPPTRPFQTDSWSCGPLTAFTLLHYMVHHRLPTSVDTFCEANAPQLRLYMAFILHKVLDETNIQQYAQRINGAVLSREAEAQLLQWMGLQLRERFVDLEYDSEEDEPNTTGAPAVQSSAKSSKGAAKSSAESTNKGPSNTASLNADATSSITISDAQGGVNWPLTRDARKASRQSSRRIRFRDEILRKLTVPHVGLPLTSISSSSRQPIARRQSASELKRAISVQPSESGPSKCAKTRSID